MTDLMLLAFSTVYIDRLQLSENIKPNIFTIVESGLFFQNQFHRQALWLDSQPEVS